MWRIDEVPQHAVELMEQPLVTVDQIAKMMGVTSHTIRRAGNERDSNWNLPAHFDLGCRLRRYLPLHVEAWMHHQPLEPWLERRCGPRTAAGMVIKGRSTERGGT